MSLYRHYSMQEVELLLGIPRTTIRHYINKGLIKVERDSENNYQQFTFNNLVQLSQIVYYREMMGYSLDSIEELLNSQQFETVEQITDKATRRLRAEIETKQQQLTMLEYNTEIMKRHHEFRDQMAIVPFGKVYSLPFAYYVQSTHPLWRILHGASEFTFDGEEFHHSRLRCLIFEHDIDRLPPGVFEQYGREAEVIEHDMCAYTVHLSKMDVRDPTMLHGILSWATKHRFRVIDPVIVSWFYPFYTKSDSYLYVEMFLPIDMFRAPRL